MGPRLPITTASKLFSAGAALLLLGACASVPVEPEAGGPGQKASSAQVLSICEKLARSKDTRLAIGLCEKAHMEDQENPVPLLLLGDMLQQQGALAQAGRAYGMAIDLDPENVEAHYGLGKVFLARNQFDLAIERFEVARELNTRDHRLYNALGVVLDNLGDHVSAQAHYKIGLELAPDNHALQKNLMLSRRLDNSVTTPAIGPRHKVVPAPVSPQTVPETVPSKPAPNSPGRLGHEPLAQAPVDVPIHKSFEAAAAIPVEAPRPEAVAPAQAGHPAVRQPSQVEAKDLPEMEPARTGAGMAQVRIIPLPPRAKPPVPVQFASRAVIQKAIDTEPTASALFQSAPSAIPSSAYDEVPLPVAQATIERGLSRAAKQGPAILASGFNWDRIEGEALPPVLKSVAVTKQLARSAEATVTTSESMVGEVTVAEVAILAAGKADGSDSPQVAPKPVQRQGETPALVRDASDPAISAEVVSVPVTEKENRLLSASLATDSMASSAGEDRFTSETLSAPLFVRVEIRPAPAEALPHDAALSAQMMSSVAPTRAREAAAGHVSSSLSGRQVTAAPLSLVPRNSLQTASLTDARVTPVDEVDIVEAEIATADQARQRQGMRETRRRFGREHEEDHETRHFEGEIWDLVDIVNPMQHIPVVATIYRDVTDDEIKPAAKIAGGTLFGGVLGFASSLVDSVIEEASGQNIGDTALAALSRPSPTPGDVDLIALNKRNEELRLAHARGR